MVIVTKGGGVEGGGGLKHLWLGKKNEELKKEENLLLPFFLERTENQPSTLSVSTLSPLLFKIAIIH